MSVTVDDLLDAREDADAANRDSLHASPQATRDAADDDYAIAIRRYWRLLDAADADTLSAYGAALEDK